MTTRIDAAAARMLKARDITARPQQRSAGEHANTPRGWVPPIQSAITIERAAAGSATPDTARFEGYASVTGKTYTMFDYFGEYDELVEQGAFEETLAQDDLSVPLVLGHDPMRRLALRGLATSPLELSEDDNGLRTIAPTLQLSDPDTAYVVPKLELGLLDEMSFRFTIEAGRWNDAFTQYTIQRVNIHRGDTSVVGYGANPHTNGSGIKREAPGPSLEARIALKRALFEDVR